MRCPRLVDQNPQGHSQSFCPWDHLALPFPQREERTRGAGAWRTPGVEVGATEDRSAVISVSEWTPDPRPTSERHYLNEC